MAKILIVDDECEIRKMLQRVLGRSGHALFEASNGQEAIEQLQRESHELVITDIVMPEKEGLETIMQIRRDFPDVKIIAISGGGRVGATHYLDMAQRVGADRTFAKPFDRTDVINAVRELLGQDIIPVQHF